MQNKKSGAFLEDVVAKIFKNWGFNTQCRSSLTDNAGSKHQIDVFASKNESFGKVNIAVECKNVSNPIGIEDLRNFQVKISRLNFSKGIFVSTAGFTGGAREFAKTSGIELWDDATLWKKAGRDKTLGEIQNVLPLKIIDPISIAMPQIRNADRYIKIKKDQTRLICRPIHVFEYSCSSQKSVKGSIYDITSSGFAALSDSSIKLVETFVKSGVDPYLISEISVLNEWQNQKLQSIPIDEKTVVEEAKLIPRIAKKEVIKRLAENIELNIEVIEGHKTIRVSGFPIRQNIKGIRTIKPRFKDIEIITQDCVYYPYWSIILSYKDKDFNRIFDSVTGKIIKDLDLICQDCSRDVTILCYYCGAPLCDKHAKSCEICDRDICTNQSCCQSAGRILKKHYCVSCAKLEIEK